MTDMSIAVLRGKQVWSSGNKLVAQFQMKCHFQVGPQAMCTLTLYYTPHFQRPLDVVNINVIPKKKAYHFFPVYFLGFS